MGGGSNDLGGNHMVFLGGGTDGRSVVANRSVRQQFKRWTIGGGHQNTTIIIIIIIITIMFISYIAQSNMR